MTSSFSIAFLSSLFVVCLFEPVPTSIVLQPRDLSMSFCLIHTESVCLLSNPFIYSHFPFSPSFLLHPSLSFSCHIHIWPCVCRHFLWNYVKIAAQLLSSQLILEVEICLCKDTCKHSCTGRLRRGVWVWARHAHLQILNYMACVSAVPCIRFVEREGYLVVVGSGQHTTLK